MTFALGQRCQGGLVVPACYAPRLQKSVISRRRQSSVRVPGPTAQRLGSKGLQCSFQFEQARHSRTAKCQSSRRSIVCTAASAPPAGFKWGADMKNLGISVGLAVAIWFIPPPSGVTLPAWHLLAIFLGTIVGIITKPLPLGAVAMLGLGATMITKTLTFAAAFSAFSSEIP